VDGAVLGKKRIEVDHQVLHDGQIAQRLDPNLGSNQAEWGLAS
jgi:hypothetical protein